MNATVLNLQSVAKREKQLGHNEIGNILLCAATSIEAYEEENAKLREQVEELVKACEALMGDCEQSPHNPDRWWQRGMPSHEALSNARDCILDAKHNTK